MDINIISSVSRPSDTQTTNTAKTSDTSFSKVLDQATANKTSLDDIFQMAADKYGVDVQLLKAIGKAESGFDPTCTSHAGAQGIMQLMPATAEYLGVKDAYDPVQNIMGGAKYISQLLKDYNGNTELALAAYNAGSGNVKKYGGIPPFKETQNYVKKVLSYYREGVTIPTDKNMVSSSTQVAVNKGTETGETASPKTVQTSEPVKNVSILSMTDAQEAALNDTNDVKLLNSLQELLNKMNSTESNYSYSDYARFMKVFLDGIAVSTLSATEDTRKEMQDDLKEKLSEFQEDYGFPTEQELSADTLVASQSINYTPAILELLTKDK